MKKFPCGVFKGLEDNIASIVAGLPDDYLEKIKAKIDAGADLHGACNIFCGHLSEIGGNPVSKFDAEPIQC